MFDCASSQNRLCIAMSAKLANIDAACRQAEVFIENLGLSSDRFAILLCLREALMNAVLHGSGNDEAQPVRLELHCAEEAIYVRVEDQGRGFDWTRAATTPPDPLRVGGRGLPIIHEYSDEVDFNETGNAIQFSKRFEG